MNRTVRWLFVAALLPVAACSSSTPPVAMAPVAPPPAYAANDMAFVNAAAASDAGEIQAGQLAATKARGPAVKRFAAQMVSAHTDTTQKLMAIVQPKGVTPDATLPQPVQDNIAMLNAAKPAAFNRDYLRGQVASHMMAVKVFQDEIANGTDPDLKQYATATLPIIQQHLRMARRLSGMRS